jgi:tetratricopeptide (TPR) repeat protein
LSQEEWTGRPTEAVALLEPVVARVVWDTLVTDLTAFRACEVYAGALERSGRLDDATATLERLRAVAETAPARLPWLPVVGSLVRCYREAGDLSRAVDLGEAALRRYNELRLDGLGGHGALVSTLAGAYSERGDHLRAKVVLDELIALTEHSGSLDDRGYAYWNAAVTAAERGHVGDGLRLAERAAALLSAGETTSAPAPGCRSRRRGCFSPNVHPMPKLPDASCGPRYPRSASTPAPCPWPAPRPSWRAANCYSAAPP